MNNFVFRKFMENVRKHRDIKLVTTDKTRNQLVSELKVKKNKPVYLGLLILEISKTLMYQFWYDYIKPKYQKNVKLRYMDRGIFIINIKTEDFYEDIANDVEK